MTRPLKHQIQKRLRTGQIAGHFHQGFPDDRLVLFWNTIGPVNTQFLDLRQNQTNFAPSYSTNQDKSGQCLNYPRLALTPLDDTQGCDWHTTALPFLGGQRAKECSPDCSKSLKMSGRSNEVGTMGSPLLPRKVLRSLPCKEPANSSHSQ